MDFGLVNFQGFFTWVLTCISDFLITPPIIWLVGLLIAGIVIKYFIALLSCRM